MVEDPGATFLGIDVGTSGVKAVLVDGARRALAEATLPLTISRPHPLWSEQNAEDWWTATEAAIAQLRATDGAAFGRIAAIGLSGQMHGAVVLGKDDKPLRPVILWNDGRSAGEAIDLHAANPGLADRLGVMPMPGLTFPKLLWLQRHEPDIFASIDCLMLPKDYIRLKLTGERVSDMSDAAGTWGFDEAARRWSPEAAAAVGLPMRCLPRLVEGSEPSGVVRPEIAAHWGLRPNVVAAGGGADAAAGAIGIGAINDGDSFISLGTSSQLVSVGNTFRPNVDSLVHAFAHAVPERWYQMGAMLTGASALAWGATILGRDVNELSSAVEAQFTHPSDLIVLPYLTGERTPHNNPNAKAVIFGLTAASGQVDVAQAIMEAVAFTLADADKALGPSGDPAAPLGASTEKTAPVAVIGGGARSKLWMRIIAGVLNRPLVRYKGGDKGPAFGAALLARLALTGEPVADVLLPPDVDDITKPEPALVEAYAPRVEKFRRLYQAVKAEF